MATKKAAANAAPVQSAPLLSLAEISGYTVAHAAAEAASRVNSQRRLFVETGKLVYHIRSSKLRRGQTAFGILLAAGVSRGSIDIAMKVAEIIEAVVTPGHLTEARFDEVMTFRIANRSRALLSGKAAVQLTPEQFAAILATGASSAIGDDLDCLTEHGVTVTDREATIAAKDAADKQAKADAEAAAKAKADEEEATRAAQAKELAEAKANAMKLAAEKAETEKQLAEANANAKKLATETAAAAPPPAPTVTVQQDEDEDSDPAPAEDPAPDSEEDEEPDPADPEKDEDTEEDEVEFGDADPAPEEDEDTEEDTLESILDDLQNAIARAAHLDDNGIKAVAHFLKQAVASMEADLVRPLQKVA